MASALGTIEALLRPVSAERETLMSDPGVPPALDAAHQSAQELQNRFIADNLRRVFRLIYRIVPNVDDAQDLTQ